MRRKYRFKLNHAIFIYLSFAFFPGCFFAHFLRMAAVSNMLPTILLGTMILVAPFLLLALGLFRLAKPKNSCRMEYGKRIPMYLYSSILIIALTIGLFITYVNSTLEVYKIYAGEIELSGVQLGWETAFASHFISGWSVACFSGLSILLIGTYYLYMQDKRKTKE